MTIYEEARSAYQSEPQAFLGIRLHGGSLFSGVQAFVETGGVEFQVFRLLFQVRQLQFLVLNRAS